MYHKHKILKLADFLREIGLSKEASDLLSLIKKKASLEPLDLWFSVLEEVDAPYSDPLFQSVKAKMKTAAGYMQEASEGLQGATPKDIEFLSKNVPVDELMKSASFSGRKIEKTAEFCKRSNWWKAIKNVGGTTAKYVIPFASLVFALIHFYYCVIELSKLFSEVPAAGLKWYDPLLPGKLQGAIDANIEDPEMLKNLVKAIKTAKHFVINFQSMLLNTVDGIKDLIFAFGNIASGGLAITIDISISVLILGIELAMNAQTEYIYDKMIKEVRDKSVGMISDLYFEKLKKQETEELPELTEELPELTEELPKL